MHDSEKAPDERALVGATRAGDGDAFAKIIDIYGRRILSYCYRMCGSGAEDLAQEIFVKLHLAIPQFDPDRALSPFLFRIAHNHCLDALRKRRVPTIPLDPAGDAFDPGSRIPDPGPSPVDLAGRAELARAVERALESLPPPYRSVLVLRHVDGLSYEEISEALGLPMATVKIRIHRGREKLQQILLPFVST
ncbi:MAG TPA: sigma-70 family RNA polymerase sigma factor [Verrucomicrobiae bacterium]|nr:sigma-70 family RNA polymerase sigma factor [Verrucomicrobiae bacterium]